MKGGKKKKCDKDKTRRRNRRALQKKQKTQVRGIPEGGSTVGGKDVESSGQPVGRGGKGGEKSKKNSQSVAKRAGFTPGCSIIQRGWRGSRMLLSKCSNRKKGGETQKREENRKMDATRRLRLNRTENKLLPRSSGREGGGGGEKWRKQHSPPGKRSPRRPGRRPSSFLKMASSGPDALRGENLAGVPGP